MAEATLDDYEIIHTQGAGESSIGGAGVWWLSRRDDYREFNVPFGIRDAMYAEIPLGTVLEGTTTGACSVIFGGATSQILAIERSFAEDMVGETITITGVGDFTIASRASMKVCTVTGDPRPGDYVFSSANGKPVKENGTSTVKTNTAIFAEGMVGQQLGFKITGKGYIIATYTNASEVIVTGDASGEANADVVGTCADLAFSIPVAPLTGMFVAKRKLRKHRVGQPGRSTIQAWYSTPQWFRPDTSQAIRGKVYIDRFSGKQPLKRFDEDGNVIYGVTGTDTQDLEGLSWELEGKHVNVLTAYAKYRLVAAATDDWDGSIVESLINKVNDDVALGCAAGTLLFRGSREEITVFYSGSPLHQAELLFLKNPTGWNNELTSRRFKRVCVNAYITNEKGERVPGVAKVLRKIKYDASVSTRKGHATGDFGAFNDMTEL